MGGGMLDLPVPALFKERRAWPVFLLLIFFEKGEKTIMKTLINRDGNGTTKNVPDVEFFGNPDGFQLICKAASQKEGWMKSTKAMEISGAGCLVQVTTQQLNPDGNGYALAEALTFVPGVQIDCVYELDGDWDKPVSRRLISMSEVARKGPRGDEATLEEPPVVPGDAENPEVEELD
jgi:hypothetical protein